MTVDEIVLDLIEISDSLEDVAERIDDSTLARRVVSKTCEQVSSLVLDMAHELETDPHDRELVADGGRYARSFRQSDVTFRLYCEHCDSEFFRPLGGKLKAAAEQFGEIEDRCEFCDVVRVLEVIAP